MLLFVATISGPRDAEGFTTGGRSSNPGGALPKTAEWGMMFPLPLPHRGRLYETAAAASLPSSAPRTVPALQESVQEAASPEAKAGDLTIQRTVSLSFKAAQGGKGGGSGGAIGEKGRCVPGAAVSRHGSAPDSSMYLLPLENNFLSGRSAPFQ